MNANRKHKSDARRPAILPNAELKVLPPKAFDVMRIHEASAPQRRLRLEGRPVVEMPVGGDLDDGGRLDPAHGLHPLVGMFAVVGFHDGRRVGQSVELAVVVHEAVVVDDACFFEEGDAVPRGRPGGGGPAFGFLPSEVGEDVD